MRKYFSNNFSAIFRPSFPRRCRLHGESEFLIAKYAYNAPIWHWYCRSESSTPWSVCSTASCVCDVTMSRRWEHCPGCLWWAGWEACLAWASRARPCRARPSTEPFSALVGYCNQHTELYTCIIKAQIFVTKTRCYVSRAMCYVDLTPHEKKNAKAFC